MGAADEGAGQREGRCPDLKLDIFDGSPVNNALRVRDMGNDPTHQEGVGKIPPQVGPQADGEAT